MDDIFMVMEFMEHDLKGLMEAQDASGPVFAMSEVSATSACLCCVMQCKALSHKTRVELSLPFKYV